MPPDQSTCEIFRLRNSAGNRSLESRSEKLLDSPLFPAFYPACLTALLQHPHRRLAIGWQDAVHTRQGRATTMQSLPKASSLSFAFEHTTGTKERPTQDPRSYFREPARAVHDVFGRTERREDASPHPNTPSSLRSVIEKIQLGFWFFLSLGATPKNLGFGQSWFALCVQL